MVGLHDMDHEERYVRPVVCPPRIRRIDLDSARAPLLSIWGGKITTFRKLAEEAAELLTTPLRITRGAWTRNSALPGGDLREWAYRHPYLTSAGRTAALGRYLRYYNQQRPHASLGRRSPWARFQEAA